MREKEKTREQLVQEAAVLRRRVAELEATVAEHQPESESQYRVTMDSMGDAIHVVDTDLRFVLLNQAFKKWNQELGLETDVIGRTIFEVFPFLPEKVRVEYQQVFNTGQTLITEESSTVGNEEFITETRKIPIFEGGRVARVVTVIRNITERKRAEEEIRWRAETLAALHETALDLAAQRELPDLLRAIVVRATNLLKAGGGGIYLYRPDTDDLEFVYTHNLEPRFAGVVLRRGEGLAGQVLESGQPLAVADYGRWEGRARQFEANQVPAWVAVPIRWGNRLLGVLDVLDDAPRTFSPADIALLERFTPLAAAALEDHRLFHDLRQQMDELKRTQAQLIQSAKMAAVGQLAAGVAHELNNPLTGVLGFSELLLRKTAPDTPAYDDLATIVTEARRARDIVRGLLNFSRQAEFHREPTHVNLVLQETLALVRRQLEKNNITIEEHYAPDLPLLLLDMGRMKQVFLNFITNAHHAMPHGGTLTVTSEQVGDEVAVRIADTGVGIPAENLPHLFEPFFTTKPGGQGTGLGLSISLGIVQDHGGRIEVESQEGQGSIFTAWLPMEDT